MLFGPITDKERLIWQRQAVKVLADFIGEAVRAELPLVHWQTGCGRMLVGTCREGDAESRRAAFLAWTRFLGIAEVTEVTRCGVTHLRGSTDDFRGCRIVVTADLYVEVGS
ncbi:hypothetical protein [Allorhizocola rhizosphaerae]|uniref:hypothetical protein n=1 Tax=Allorhizocola rhizosphaerae TaxID=1872709 RepID=UPI000E3DB8CE|nr:hypothetical protein [Allorhizocola rhizosphaerae]